MSTATAISNDLRLIELRAENWKKLKCFILDAEGKHAIIRGKNTAGKTSCLEALETLLCGANSRKIPDPIRRGETKAVITADLGDITIKRTITEKGQTLDVRAASGTKITTPQQILDQLRGTTFDLIGFMGARPQDQVDAILAVCKVLPPVDEVEEATGEKCPAKDGESADAYLGRLSADDVGQFFVRRRDAGRVWDQKRKALAEQQKIVEQLGGDTKDVASASDLLDRIQALQQKEDSRRSAEAEAYEAANAHDDAVRRLKSLEADLESKTKRVLDLERQLDEARRDQQHTADRISTGREVVTELKAAADQAAEAAKQHPDHRGEIVDLRAKVKHVEQQQEQRLRRKAALDQENRLTLEENDAKFEHERLDKILNRLRYLRAHLLDNVNLGIPGLEVGHGELRLNGLSIRSASTAEQLTIAVAVATRQESKLKVLWVDSAERLDLAHRALLLQLASDAGWQVILTVVSEDEEPVIQIVEGSEAA